jgi:hypothetical protein
MTKSPWTYMIILLTAFGAFGCSSNPKPKTAGYNSDSEAHPIPGATPADQKAVDAQPPSNPQPPAPVQPSTKWQGVEADYNGVNTPIKGGETFSIKETQMLFFYSKAASPDCGNVTVEGDLDKASNAGICQVGFKPIEKKLKAGTTKDVAIAVNGDRVAFKVAVTH